MAKQFPSIQPEHREFIERQHLFFTASAAVTGRVNVSPKGLKLLRVLDPYQAAYIDLTGSGAETAAHAHADGRLTLMFAAFEGPPMILRLYGRSRSHPRGSEEYQALLDSAFGRPEPFGARQIVTLDIELVQTSCGFGMPHMQYVRDRPSLVQWAENLGQSGLREYRQRKNRLSLDGFPTGLKAHLED